MTDGIIWEASEGEKMMEINSLEINSFSKLSFRDLLE